MLPAGGGTKEMAMRASNSFKTGDVKMPTLIEHFRSIATASVSTSAHEAFDINYLQATRDTVCMNQMRNIAMAKEKALQLSVGYIPPSLNQHVEVLGRAGLSTLFSAINEFRLGAICQIMMSRYQEKIAYVICGGRFNKFSTCK